MLLFAYGTLRDPRQLAAVVGPGVSCTLIGPATVAGALYDVGAYPALVRAGISTDPVAGVVLEIDDAALPRLDAYEGVAEGLYRRERCLATLADGGVVETWVYVFARPVTGLRRIAQWPAGGD